MNSVVSEELFTDSDTDYAEIKDTEKPRKKIIASPRVSKQLLKTGNDLSEIETSSSKRYKSPRSLKQQHVANLKSPGKSAIRSLSFPDDKHVPLTEDRRKDPEHVPYYLSNFECILRGVIDETSDKELFNEEELAFVFNFRSLSLNAKKLFCRLFQRKKNWLLRKNINYDEITDIDTSLKLLCDHGFLSDGSQLVDLETLLNVLSAPAIKQLCKSMNISSKNGLKKEDCVAALVAHSKKKSFFAKSDMSALITKKARDLLECEVFRVKDDVNCIFMRILSLYSLSNFWDERESERGQQTSAPQLTTILLQNTGRLVFPVYQIIREKKIFQSREELLQFETVCALESEMSEFLSNKDWTGALVPIEKGLADFNDLLENKEVDSFVRELPDFLRRFTRGAVLAYVLTKGVDVYERLKDHQKAVKVLRILVQQDLYLPDYHGHWYERLALDLDQHLKSPIESLEAIKQGFDDKHVQEARLLSLCQRVTKILSSKKNSSVITLTEKKAVLDHKRWLTPQDPKLITIQGKMMPKANLPGEKTVFVAQGKDSDLLCSVEEFVKEHFKNEKGYTNGIHAEGSVINTMAAVLFWDVIYNTEVPDVFRSPQQPVPLDYNSPHFYIARKDVIEERLKSIAEWSKDELCAFVTDVWDVCSQITACPANWELFTSLSHFLGLIKCFTGAQLSGICRRLMMNHRHTRSGFPDLTMWDTNENRVAFVEVKGPNDRLSNKQILWLDYLGCLGIEAVVCHIEALNGKRLQPAQTQAKRSKLSPKRKRERKSSGDDFK